MGSWFVTICEQHQHAQATILAPAHVKHPYAVHTQLQAPACSLCALAGRVPPETGCQGMLLSIKLAGLSRCSAVTSQTWHNCRSYLLAATSRQCGVGAARSSDFCNSSAVRFTALYAATVSFAVAYIHTPAGKAAPLP